MTVTISSMFEAFLKGYALGTIISRIKWRWVFWTLCVLVVYFALRHGAWSFLAWLMIVIVLIGGFSMLARRRLS